MAADDAPQWYGQPSLSYLGPGEYQADAATNQSYYRNFYRSGQVQRVFCHEHTGLLERRGRRAG